MNIKVVERGFTATIQETLGEDILETVNKIISIAQKHNVSSITVSTVSAGLTLFQYLKAKISRLQLEIEVIPNHTPLQKEIRMKNTLLQEAKELGHNMSRINPERYECTQCEAAIYIANSGNEGWQSFKAGNFCPTAKIKLTPIGRAVLNQELSAATD